MKGQRGARVCGCALFCLKGLAKCESCFTQKDYTLTGLSDVCLPPDPPSTAVSTDELFPVSPSRRSSASASPSIKAFRRWLSSPVRRLSLVAGGKSQSSKSQSLEDSSRQL